MSVVQRSRNVLSHSGFWGWTLASVTLVRAFSYWFRPPVSTHRVVVLVELVPYRAWALLLFASALFIIVNSVDSRRRLSGLIGHVMSVFCYLTFCASIVADAAFYGAPWAGAGTVLLTAVLHFGRLLLIAGGQDE